MLAKLLFCRITVLLPKDNAQAHEELNWINNMLSYATMCIEYPIAKVSSCTQPKPLVKPTQNEPEHSQES